MGKVREVAEDAFDSAEETFRHFVMDVGTHNKNHPEDEVVDDHHHHRQQQHVGDSGKVSSTFRVHTRTNHG